MLNELLRTTRARSLALAAPLSDEDAQLQSMPDASPAKWHLAHTTWFFETLVLTPYLPDYCVFDEHWPRLFNSYYESLGPRHARPQRGLLSRPSLTEVKAYRQHVDAALADLLPLASPEAQALVELGCHHEQQHQELLLTDILHAFSCNPLLPAYDAAPAQQATAPAEAWLRHPGGIVHIGHEGDDFAFDGMVGNTPVVIAARVRAAAPGALTIVGLAALGASGCMKWRADDGGSDGHLTLLTARDRLFMSFGHVDDGHLSRVRDDFFETWAQRLPYGDEVKAARLVGSPFSNELHALGHERAMVSSVPRM